jgi:hypothetical protein
MAEQESWRTQVVLHGIRWANNILTEVVGNHTGVLSPKARERLRDTLTALHEAEHEIRHGSPGPSGVAEGGGDAG